MCGCIGAFLFVCVICVVTCQLIPSELGVQYTKVLECDAAAQGNENNQFNVTIETHVQSANIQEIWPPLERQRGKSLITVEYLPAQTLQNISTQLAFFDVQCKDIVKSSNPQFTYQLVLSTQQVKILVLNFPTQWVKKS
eukprot:TRINITY_DN12237_c0_g3_i1.p1 TRINITY_DN12237_c0_g3~~TRINITY_DN12237_c0_g3_i1.p1  ORF type:complete len:139 (-),score=9.52 TRINITY_DN12237_c0_g3_i1:154-570(-)